MITQNSWKEKSNKSKSNFLMIILGLIIIIAIITVFIFVVWQFGIYFTSLESDLSSAIIVASSAFAISIVSLILTKQWETRKEIEKEHRKEKKPIYMEFVAFWLKLFLDVKQKKKIDDDDSTKFLSEFTQKIIIWGSDEVIKKYSDLRRILVEVDQNEKDPKKALENTRKQLQKFEDLLYAIRVDIGHKNFNLNQTDLLALFINKL